MKKYLAPLLLLTLLLTGCKEKPSDSHDSLPSEEPSVETSTSTETSLSSSEEKPVVDDKWPAAYIADYLKDNGLDLVIPGLVLTEEPEIEYVDDDPDYNPYIYIYAIGADREDEYVDILEAAGFEVIYDDSYGEDFAAYYAYDEDEFVEIQFSYFPGFEQYEPGMEIFIEALVNNNENGGSDKGDEEYFYEEVAGWPTANINDFLKAHNFQHIFVPSLTVKGDTVVSYIVDDPEYGTFLEIYIEGEDLGETYVDILEANYYLVQLYEEGVWDAYDSTFALWIEVYSLPADDEDPAETLIYLNVLDGENGGGEVVDPTNPDNFATFDFTNQNQITGEKNKDKTTWTAAGTTMSIEKNNSTVDVGNVSQSKTEGFWSNPLRLYAVQKVTFTAPASVNIEQIVLNTDPTHDDSIENFIDSAPSSTSVFVTGSSVIYSFAKPVNSVSFTMSAQARLMGATLYFI